MIELAYSGKIKEFDSIEDAQKFAKTLCVGFDIWVNNSLYQSKMIDFRNGGFVETFYNQES